MSNGRKQNQPQKSRSKDKAAKGRTVYIGQRPKTPLYIGGLFLLGLLMLILAIVFSPRRKAPPEPPTPAATNAPAPATP